MTRTPPLSNLTLNSGASGSPCPLCAREAVLEFKGSHTSQLPVKRYRIDVTGTIQGVGFRPFVYRLAVGSGLSGYVRNNPQGVEMEVEGTEDRLDVFLTGLLEKSPPASLIVDLTRTEVNPKGESRFIIQTSADGSGKELVIPPDISTCDECLAELLDPADRRYRYPFINCTNCGPRYTIVKGIPYDRDKTTMDPFTMCEACRQEYEDPLDRRFHAQPNACRECGPSLMLLEISGRKVPSEDPIAETVRRLLDGEIVAIKGIGGFHLAVDATRSEPVRRLRERKRREEKPFAIMSPDLVAVRSYASVNPDEERLLLHPSRPIVLLEKAGARPIAEAVAPGNRYLGVMLPYTPLHHLLFHANGVEPPIALVMTSANLGEEPIVMDNREALERLSGIADAVLVHDREIEQRADDSVIRVCSGNPYIIRRSRGYVPAPVMLKGEVGEILGCGAFLKVSVCLTRGKRAYLSQHIGDLENELAFDFYSRTIAHLERILDLRPKIVAHDLHPDYPSTRYALEREVEVRVAVQHHHAHIVSCLAENGESGPVIGLSCDGTGLGDDGTIWGGEVLLADLSGYTRLGHFEPFPLPGGDSAIREPWRTAYSLLRESFGGESRAIFGRLFPEVDAERAGLIGQMLERSLNSPMTSSLGRLFDGVSAILGISRWVTYEGQAAAHLEMAMNQGEVRSYPPALQIEGDRIIMRTCALIRSIVEDLEAGHPSGAISAGFHDFVVDSLYEATRLASERTGVRTVALSGGCFQNVYLLEALSGKLRRSGFPVLVHRNVPPNDGGISLGQAVVADSLLRAGKVD